MPPKGRGKRNSLGKKRKAEKEVEEDEEYEDDNLDIHEKDGFVVDDISPDEEEAVAARPVKEGRRKRRRKHREDSPELAEGDLQLLEDEGIHVKRKKKKLKKLRKKYVSDDENDDLLDELRDLEDDNPDTGAHVEEKSQKSTAIDYEDDMDDFIVDGGRSKRRRSAARKGKVSSDAVRASRSLFGDADDIFNYRPSTEPLRNTLQRRRG